MNEQGGIRRAQSCHSEARDAVREFHAGVVQPEMALVVFFCSSDYDLAALGDEMNRCFAGVQVVGCTTAGEIGPAGYLGHSLSGASFPAGSFAVVSGLVGNLHEFQSADGQQLVEDLLPRLESQAPQADSDNSFALLLIDGLSVREEPVTRALQGALGRLPLIGGSAGDGSHFSHTRVYFAGAFHADSAVVTVISSRLPFKLFMTQHFVATDDRLVVTDVDTARRTVREINGVPAAKEYARILGVDVADLGPGLFAASPVVVLINGLSYVRSIQQANADGSLTFFCAIENGLVLRVTKGVDLPGNLEQTFALIRAEIGPPELVLGCDCVLRKLEIDQGGEKARIDALVRGNNVTGFNTYGEQFRGVHVNQTFVGIAIGAGAPATDET
jgi:hypothetical protein